MDSERTIEHTLRLINATQLVIEKDVTEASKKKATTFDHNGLMQKNPNLNKTDDFYKEKQQSPNHRTFQVAVLELKKNTQGFYIKTDQGDELIKDGDQLLLGDYGFIAYITKQQIIHNPDPLNENPMIAPSSINTIWDKTLPQSNATELMTPILNQLDPLKFLGDEIMPSSPQYNASDNLIPDANRPSFAYNAETTIDPWTIQENVLNELGINHNHNTCKKDDSDCCDQSALNPQILQQQKNSILPSTQQSPMDVLDEYLQDEFIISNAYKHNEFLSRQSSLRQEPQLSYNFSEHRHQYSLSKGILTSLRKLKNIVFS